MKAAHMDQSSNFCKLLHQPIRLRVVAHLVQCGGEAPFVGTRQALGIENPGLLSAHARVLAEGGCINLRKSFVGRRTRTVLALTEAGRCAFNDHMAALVTITSSAREETA